MTDDRWYRREISKLHQPLSAWFSLDCATRTRLFFPRFPDVDLAAALGTVQAFLLGRATWHDLELTRKKLETSLWSANRSANLLDRVVLQSIIASTFFDEWTRHADAASLVRKLDARSAQPLIPGQLEADHQRDRLAFFAELATEEPLCGVLREYRTGRAVSMLPMVADAMQEVGFAPPLV